MWTKHDQTIRSDEISEATTLIENDAKVLRQRVESNAGERQHIELNAGETSNPFPEDYGQIELKDRKTSASASASAIELSSKCFFFR